MASFSDQYDYAKSIIKNPALAWDVKWNTLITSLKQLLEDAGLNSDHSGGLDKLRTSLRTGGQSEDQVILTGAKAIPLTTDGKRMAAVIKFLSHLYYFQAGKTKTWIFSLPDTFTDWPTWALENENDEAKIKTLLKSSTEKFSSTDKEHISTAVLKAIAWCADTDKVLASAAASDAKALAKVKCWFGDSSSANINSLKEGYKKINESLKGGKLVVTDQVGLRGTNDALKDVEAFVFAGAGRETKHEVVYIEKDFFKAEVRQVLPPFNNWPRILIHELSHILIDTKDHLYAHKGIDPKLFPSGQKPIDNADSWAFFACDCAGQLATEGIRNRALNGLSVVGNITWAKSGIGSKV